MSAHVIVGASMRALEDRMQGGSGSMSQMVREALDHLITERTRRNAA